MNIPLECSSTLVVLCKELVKCSGIKSTTSKAIEITYLGSGNEHGESNFFVDCTDFVDWQLITGYGLAIGYSLQSSLRLRLMLVYIWL